MRKLIAKYPILYLSKQYDIGEELVANNPEMVKAWLDAGTAEWVEDEESKPDADGTVDGKSEDELPPATATPVVAEAGLAGDAIGSETDENLVGKIPKTPARARK